MRQTRHQAGGERVCGYHHDRNCLSRFLCDVDRWRHDDKENIDRFPHELLYAFLGQLAVSGREIGLDLVVLALDIIELTHAFAEPVEVFYGGWKPIQKTDFRF